MKVQDNIPTIQDHLIKNEVKAVVIKEPDPMTQEIQRLSTALREHTAELSRLNSTMYDLQSALKNMNFTVKGGY